MFYQLVGHKNQGKQIMFLKNIFVVQKKGKGPRNGDVVIFSSPGVAPMSESHPAPNSLPAKAWEGDSPAIWRLIELFKPC